MSLISGSSVTGAGSVAAYQIQRSLRFNSADATYLNRTFTTPTNNLIWTWSAWIKRSDNANPYLFTTTATDGAGGYIYFVGSLVYWDDRQAGNATVLNTSAVYRDQSAWYHLMVVTDRTQATASNRAKMYVNGSQVTAFQTADYPNQNEASQFNSAIPHYISAYSSYFNGYMTEINFVDGQALTPSSFGQTNASTGVWEPIAYTGTYGNNGFYLNFSDNSNTTAATLGKDYSGNGNNWTPNNFSVTAGAGNDSLVDSPTSYGTDTGAGGEVRGNYCTLNSVSPLATATANGNLQLNTNATNCVPGTIGVTTGKWYWEGLLTTQTSSQQYFGVANASFDLSKTVGEDAFSWGMTVQSNASNGKAQHNNVESSSYATFGNGDICMVAYDMDTGRIWFGRNGTWFNSGAPASGTGAIYSNLSGTIVPMLCNDINSGGVLQVNFGQRAFAYTAPSGFKALCTQNLPTPTIGATSTTLADDYFTPKLYTGTGSTNAQTVGFAPDFIWFKSRTQTYTHYLFNTITSGNNFLQSSNANTEGTSGDSITFDANGFTITAGSALNEAGQGANNMVAWNWKANGAGSSNTAGTITSTVSASTTSGFSVVTYTGTGANATVGHGLGVAPSMIIIKGRSTGYDWRVYHTSVGNTSAVFLNTTAASAANSTYWNDTSPTSTVFSLGTNAGMNESAGTYVAYCFAPVAGYSAFGSYTGDGSTDGPFVYTGFRPSWIMIKRTDSTGNWQIQDTARTPYNWTCAALFADSSAAEVTNEAEATYGRYYLSNGFKIKSSHTSHNASGGTYIYMAFAENPFKYSLAR